MKNKLDFETALEILNSGIFEDDHFMGAMYFISEAFNVSTDSILEQMEKLSKED